MQTLVAEILALWRCAERLTTTLPPGGPDHAVATLACVRLGDLYELLTAPMDGTLGQADTRTRLLAELDARRAP